MIMSNAIYYSHVPDALLYASLFAFEYALVFNYFLILNVRFFAFFMLYCFKNFVSKENIFFLLLFFQLSNSIIIFENWFALVCRRQTC